MSRTEESAGTTNLPGMSTAGRASAWARARTIAARTLPAAGIDVRRLARTIRLSPAFVRDYRAFAARSRREQQPMPRWDDLFPVLADRDEASGVANGHYFHQDLWAARRIYAAKPTQHYDIGSRIDGFVSSLIVFQPVTVIDVRPLDIQMDNLRFVQADATDLAFLADGSVESISSLHALEHFGLGRYGDPLEPAAWRRAMAELVRVSAPGGRVYVSVPIGRPRVMFNAHRVFEPAEVLRALAGLELVSFSAVDDRGDLVADADPAAFGAADYSCGLFELTRPAT
jgi:hypothetical protein